MRKVPSFGEIRFVIDVAYQNYKSGIVCIRLLIEKRSIHLIANL